VDELPDHPLGLHDDSELSIAGLQDKMLLVALDNGGWGRPVRGRPSTHVLKVEDHRFPGLAAAEAACLALARSVDLTTVDASVVSLAGRSCLIVSRFDRAVTADGTVRRIHQEDACQALGRDPENARGRGKYEDAGGPSLREVADLLDRYAADPESQLRRLVAAVTFTVCIGNADAHGKNVGILHPTADRIELAPLYDTVPTVLWSNLRSRGAMSLNGRWLLPDVTLDDVVDEAAAWRVPRQAALQVAASTAERLATAATSLAGAMPLTDRLAGLVAARAGELLAAA
jgi:serine/threonine-protein kinase HipA